MTCHILRNTCPRCGSRSGGFACSSKKEEPRIIERTDVCTSCRRIDTEKQGWTVEEGEHLREDRQGAGLNLRQLAKLVGVSIPDLSAYERATKAPSKETKVRLHNALCHPADRIEVNDE